MKTLMCLVPSNYAALDARGLLSLVIQRDLDGYWDKVITVHPFCKQERAIELSERHTVMEYNTYDIIGTIAKLNLLAKQKRVTAIKAHDPYFTGPIGLILSRCRGIPYVVMICSSYDLVREAFGRGQLWFDWLDKLVSHITLSRAEIVFGGSDDASLWALRNGAKRVETVRTGGVAPEHFTAPESRTKWQDTVTGRIVLFVGRLSVEKFPEDAIQAYKVMRLSHPDSTMVVAGDGPLKKQLISKYGQHGDVKIPGFIGPPASLASLMATADVALVPRGGSALVELALAEAPIVAYDVDWHSELIHDGSGVLVPYRDWVSMADEASRLLADEGRTKAMGRIARRFALAQHSLDAVQEKERQCFNEILSRRR